MPKYWALGAALAVSIGLPLAATSAVELPDEYSQLIQQHSRIGTLDGGLFGDHVGLSTGNLEIVQTDVDLPGNNALPVRVGRRFLAGNIPAKGHFGDWDLDIPHLHGLFGAARAENVRWLVDGDDDHRCSQFGPPPEVYVPVSAATFTPDEYWHGTSFYLPGSGDQELLYWGDRPTSGGPYVASTREGAAVRCVSALAATSEAGSTGEGFEVVTSDGTVYRFDQMVGRSAYPLHKSDAAPAMLASTQTSMTTTSGRTQSDAQDIQMTTAAATCCTMGRREMFLYPTRVTDRFGNTVTYTWDSTNPWRLLHITASDGRNIDFSYSSSDATSNLILSVTATGAQPRTWSYAYGGTSGGLTSVTQPDLKTWQFNLSSLYSARAVPTGPTCDTLYSGTPNPYVGTISAPSGATAEYTVVETTFGRSWVDRDCKMATDQANEYVTDPYLFVGLAITRKKITGPGLPTDGLVWSYDYGTPNACWDPRNVPSDDPDAVICTASSPVSRTTTVIAPDGVESRYSFGNRARGLPAQINEGLLLVQKDGVVNGIALRTTTFEYGDGDASPYGSYQGSSLRRRGDWMITGQRRPQRSVVTTQQGTTFSRSVASNCSGMPYCFDLHARPTSVIRTGINSAPQTESTLYDDDTVHWVLGQVARRTIDGMVAAQTTFDANHMPWKTYAFGKLKNTFTYNADGTIATVADGNGNVTTYSNWKRGIPQTVHFPATPEATSGATRTAAVRDEGWIDSVTDENGFATSYVYDKMGRITQVRYPANDSVTWTATNSEFKRVDASENGIAAGHWKQTVNTGGAYKVTLFDALWRPVLVREYDAADIPGTDRYVTTAYDKAGRVIDASYPLGPAGSSLTLASDATWRVGSLPPAGVHTSYDALGRPTSVQQDSELGVLTTRTEYLAGFVRRVTDARLNATTEQFMARDTPTFDWPVQIDAPEHQRTTIARDTFGKPTAITRGESP